MKGSAVFVLCRKYGDFGRSVVTEMLNIKYHKDLNHNYMIIKADIDGQKPNYQHRMITDNRIKHLLSCKIKYVDGKTHFYYEISSRQSLRSLFERKALGYEQLFHLFEQIGEASRELENFMLDSRCLVLHPEHIYVEPETEEYFFLYYPDYAESEAENTDYALLAEFLVERVEHEQEEAVSAAYRVYELIQDGTLILSEIFKIFDMSKAEKTEGEEAEPVQEEVKVLWEGEEKAAGNECACEDEDRQAARSLWPSGVVAFLCMAGAAGIFCLLYYCPLSERERLLSTVGIILLTLLSALFLLYFIVNIIKCQKCHVQGRGAGGAMEEKVMFSKRGGCTEQNSYSGHPLPEPAKPAEQPEEYGNTVFMESSLCGKENKLYGTNKGNKYHIDLDRLPCTVGKLAGSVDVVIRDSTVSRIHARFTERESGIYVTDLNSTNGTFKNGLRLDPNETVLIEQGDELRFGKMTFCYR